MLNKVDTAASLEFIHVGMSDILLSPALNPPNVERKPNPTLL